MNCVAQARSGSRYASHDFTLALAELRYHQLDKSPRPLLGHSIYDGPERCWLHDPFIFVLLLTVVVFLAGMGFETQTPLAMIVHWGDGFWNLLAFSMQMILILVTGWVLATTPFFRRILSAVATLARRPGQAIVLVTLVSCRSRAAGSAKRTMHARPRLGIALAGAILSVT